MRPVMCETKSFVTNHLIDPLANIVLDYMTSDERDWGSIAEVGEYETCLQVGLYGDKDGFDSTRGLYGAICGKNVAIQKLMISRGAIESAAIGLYVIDKKHTWPSRLSQACMDEIEAGGPWRTTKNLSLTELEKLMKDHNAWY